MPPAPFRATKHLTEGFQRNPICLDFGLDRAKGMFDNLPTSSTLHGKYRQFQVIEL
jgi:hypothetical protein